MATLAFTYALTQAQRLAYPRPPLRAGTSNKIGDEGARALADGIKELKELKELELYSECVISCEPSRIYSCRWHAHITPS